MASRRLLFLVDRFFAPMGGAETQARLLVRYLSRRGHQVMVVTRDVTTGTSETWLDGQVTCIGSGGGDGLGSSPRFFLRSMHAIFRQRKSCDLSIAFQLTASGLAAAIVGKAIRTPSIIRFAGSGGAGDIATSRRSWHGRIKLALAKRFAHRYIAVGQDMRGELVEAGFPSDRIEEIPNGVDVDRFIPVSPRDKDRIRGELDLPSGPVAVFVGRFAPEKGLPTLLEAWELLRERGKDRATLLLIGDGPLDLYGPEPLVQSASPSGVLVRRVKRDVSSFLQAADLFILPSQSEGMSNALLEAMSVGLPVIATTVGASPQMIDDHREGLLIPPNDPHALAEAIEHLLTDGELCVRCGQRARQRVQRDYAIGGVGNAYEQLFEQLIGNAHAVSPQARERSKG